MDTTVIGRRCEYVFPAITFCIALFLFLYNLDNQYLWQDEAQTALLSKTILTHGIPLGYDGRNFFSQETGDEYGKDYIWKWHPWLPYYLLALFFKLFGVSTFTARLPFALFGVATTVLTYFFARSITADKRTAALANVLLVISVTFLILSRQCRYYSLIAFFSLSGLYGYLMMLQNKKAGLAVFFASSILLFHCQVFFCANLLVTVFIHSLLFERQKLIKVFLLSVVVVVVNLPWFIWASGAEYTIFLGSRFFNRMFFSYLKDYLLSIHRYVFPLCLLLIPFGRAVFLCIKRRNIKAAFSEDVFMSKNVSILLLFVVCTVTVLSVISPLSFVRYMTQLIPVLYIITAIILMSVIRSRFKTSIIIIGVIFTAVFLADYRYQRSYAERAGISYPNFFDFIYEITHDYDGPVEGIARYLNAHGDKDDVVAITYGDMPLKFYTQMKIVGGLTGEDLSPAKEADWVIFRKQLFKGNVEVAEYFIKNIPKPNYEMILIDYPDIPYENREDPKEHRFRTAVNEDRVIIYRLIK